MNVGYDLYLKLLEEAVLEEKGEKPRSSTDCTVELLVNANLPEKYVEDSGQRVDLYRRIAAIHTEEERADLLDEMIDRFGEPPASAVALCDIALLRARAAVQDIMDIRQKDGRIYLTWAKDGTGSAPHGGTVRHAEVQRPFAAQRRRRTISVAAPESKGTSA